MKKVALVLLSFCVISFSFAQSYTIQDFTRTNRLTGRPIVPPESLPPTTDNTPSGTMCGSWNSNDGGPHTDCLGHNPGVSCPAGYFRGRGFAADGAWFLTCFKG